MVLAIIEEEIFLNPNFSPNLNPSPNFNPIFSPNSNPNPSLDPKILSILSIGIFCLAFWLAHTRREIQSWMCGVSSCFQYVNTFICSCMNESLTTSSTFIKRNDASKSCTTLLPFRKTSVGYLPTTYACYICPLNLQRKCKQRCVNLLRIFICELV